MLHARSVPWARIAEFVGPRDRDREHLHNVLVDETKFDYERMLA